jgi:DNA-binding NarL/FixJ family response regulator
LLMTSDTEVALAQPKWQLRSQVEVSPCPSVTNLNAIAADVLNAGVEPERLDLGLLDRFVAHGAMVHCPRDRAFASTTPERPSPAEAPVPVEIPFAHLRPPRPPLTELLVNSRPETLEAAYGHGYTMPQIARQLGLHQSTISRRLARRRAQIKT